MTDIFLENDFLAMKTCRQCYCVTYQSIGNQNQTEQRHYDIKTKNVMSLKVMGKLSTKIIKKYYDIGYLTKN